MRELRALTPATDPNTFFPITVYINAHLKIRVAIELAFSGSLPEARSIMRKLGAQPGKWLFAKRFCLNV
jgi:hypothetical protein